MKKYNMDESKIPNGVYCYYGDYICPYRKTKIIETPSGGVKLYYCEYLNMCDSYCTDEEFEMLIELHGSQDAVWDAYPLDLLWDSCKECGEKDDDDIF